MLTRIPVPTRDTPANTEAGMCRVLALSPEGRVTELGLQDHLRSAPIPPELGQLTGLKCLHLPALPNYHGWRRYRLTGAIPPELGQLRQLLATLDLSLNALTGDLPDALGQLRNLQSLRLHNNGFSGPLPQNWSQLANLTELTLKNNQLSGPLPPE